MQISDDELISDLSEIEIHALFLLSGAGCDPIPGSTAYQKEIFFIVNNDEELRDAANFESYTYGPYSDAVTEAMSHLIAYCLAQECGSAKKYYCITERGKKIVENLKHKHPEIDIERIDEIKMFLNNLTHDELILFTYVLKPDYATESLIRDSILPRRVSLASDMYVHGKVDLEMASYLSGLPMEEFLDEIRKRRVSRENT